MATDIGTIAIQISASSFGLHKELKRSEADLGSFRRNVERTFGGGSGGSIGRAMFGGISSGLGGMLSSMTRMLSSPLAMLSGAGLGIAGGFSLGSIVTDSIRLAAEIEDTAASFKVMLGDAERAKGLFSEIRQMAASTPLTTQELADSAKALLGVGTEADQIIPTLRMLGDLAQGDGVKLRALAVVYGQVKGAGRLMGQDFLQFVNQGVNVGGELAKVLGVSNAEVRSLMSEGKISFGDLQRALIGMTSEGGRFFGLMEERSKTFNGLLSTLKDNWQNLLASLGQAIIEEFDLKPAMQRLSEILDRGKDGVGDLRPMLRDIKEAAAEFGDALYNGLANSVVAAAELVNTLNRLKSAMGEDGWDVKGWVGGRGPNFLERNATLGGVIGHLGFPETGRSLGWLGPGGGAWGTRQLLGDLANPSAPRDGDLINVQDIANKLKGLRDQFKGIGEGIGSETARAMVPILGGAMSAEFKRLTQQVRAESDKLTKDQIDRIKDIRAEVDPVGEMRRQLAEWERIIDIGLANGEAFGQEEYQAGIASIFNKFVGDIMDDVKLAGVALKDSSEAVSAIAQHRVGGATDPQERAAAALDALVAKQQRLVEINDAIHTALTGKKFFVANDRLPN
jgi:tape measure domain-containing protein